MTEVERTDWFWRNADVRDPTAFIRVDPAYFASECAAAIRNGTLVPALTGGVTQADVGVTERIADLELALGLALAWLGAQEPGDSRAVSDEFVAMAAILCKANDRPEECREIINLAMLRVSQDGGGE